MLPKTQVEKVVNVFSEIPNAGAGVFTFHGIKWIEDPECPEGHLYFLPAPLGEMVARGHAKIIKDVTEAMSKMNPYE